MLSLSESLGNEFEYDNKIYHINLAFDTVLRFYEMLDDERLEDAEKVATAFEMFFNQPVKDADFAVTAFEQISKYISMKPYGNDDDEEDQQHVVRDPRRLYSFKQDAEAIFASFYDQYGMNLIQEQGKLHWDEFKALFQGLGPQTYFQRIIEIRTKDTKDLEGEQLSKVIQAQQFYELDINKSQAAKEEQFANFGEILKNWAQ
ncbi:Gp15 family bacteriophage protein [Limosilactobacillus oris]|uniref:Gp15 family bacteriophage protein n=1 Tax=Limosilactobacillus oris TaxID=1632 RepID=UPI00388EE06D